jgi:ribosomal protein S27E
MGLWNIFLWALMVLLSLNVGVGTVRDGIRTEESKSIHKSTLRTGLFPIAEASPTPAAIPTVEELEEPEVPEEKPPPKEPEQEMATIQCPGCSAKMTVPKLAKLQTVTCENCGLSGELKI